MSMPSFTRTKPILNICTLGHVGYGRMLAAAITKVLAAQNGATQVAPNQIGTEPIFYSTAQRYYSHSVPAGDHDDFTTALYRNLTWADGAILVVAVQEGVSNAMRVQLKIAQQHRFSLLSTDEDLGASHTKLVVFLDTDGLSTDAARLASLKQDVLEVLEAIQFCDAPGSHSYLANVLFVSGSSRAALAASNSQAPECRPIADLLTMMDAHLPTPKHSTQERLFMAITDVLPDPTGVGVIVTGSIERGHIGVGDSLSLVGHSPHERTGIMVSKIAIFGNQVDEARAGDFVHLTLRGLTVADVQRGQTLGGDAVTRFAGKVELIQPRRGYPVLLIPDLEPRVTNYAEDEEALYTEEELEEELAVSSGDTVQLLANTAIETATIFTPDGSFRLWIGGDEADVWIKLEQAMSLREGSIFALAWNGRMIGKGVCKWKLE